MYRIVIADDESIVRNGMRDRIDWEGHGFELVGVCENGQKALEAIEQTRPDVVLADIYMPLMNGLDLSGAIAERFPDTRVVLLTGYDRIEYAQEAVRKRVSDFLLKPITPQELRGVLDRMKRQLDCDCSERERRRLLEAQLAASVPLLRERTLNSLIRRGGGSTRMERSLHLCGLSWNYASYVLALFERDDRSAGPDGVEQAELDLIELGEMVDVLAGSTGGLAGRPRSTNAPIVRFRTTEGALALVFASDDVDHCNRNALQFSEAIVDRAGAKGRLSVSAGVGLPVKSVHDLPLTYEQAREALAFRYRNGGGVVFDFRDVAATEEPAGSCDQPQFEQIARLVKSGDLSETMSAIDVFVDSLRRGRKSEPACRTELVRLYLEIVQAGTTLGIPGEAIFSKSDAFREILEAATLDSACLSIRNTVEQIHARLEARRARRCERLVAEARTYIEQHFSEPDLQLSDVIREVAASTSYFSQVFKNETGRTFVEYLTNARVEHARRLIRVGMDRVCEIAEACGYRDAHYFSMVFKKYTGMTATQFRKYVERGEMEPV